MNDRPLRRMPGRAEGLTDRLPQPRPESEKVMRMMDRWWEGWTLARIAHEHGVSRQRVSDLLNWAGCTAALRHQANRSRADSRRRAPAQRVVEARQLLTHPLAHRLTVRQRCAVLWQARGLIYTDIARRMGTSAQAVRYFLVGARWRLERLARRRLADHGQHTQPTIPDIDCSCLEELLSGAGAAHSFPASSVAAERPGGLPAAELSLTAQLGASRDAGELQDRCSLWPHGKERGT